MEIMVTGLHYYVEDVAQFLASLTVGDVFTLIHEEYNIVDRNAVAVVQRSNMVGHVNRDEAGELLKLMAGKRLCHARFTGEHDGDTCLYLEVEPMVECEGKWSTETLLPPSAIGFEEPPFVLPVEYAIESAMDRVRAAVVFLDTCHVRGAAFHGVLDELPAHLEALLDVCGLSLSLECNLCRKELRALLKRLKRMGDEARDVVIPYMNRQNELEAAMRDKAKAGRQLQATLDELSALCQRKYDMHGEILKALSIDPTKREQMEGLQGRVEAWIKSCTIGSASLPADNLEEMAYQLYYHPLPVRDLYLLYLHIIENALLREGSADSSTIINNTYIMGDNIAQGGIKVVNKD